MKGRYQVIRVFRSTGDVVEHYDTRQAAFNRAFDIVKQKPTAHIEVFDRAARPGEPELWLVHSKYAGVLQYKEKW